MSKAADFLQEESIMGSNRMSTGKAKKDRVKTQKAASTEPSNTRHKTAAAAAGEFESRVGKERLEEMLLEALEDKREDVEVTPEWWARTRAEIETREKRESANGAEKTRHQASR